jgi:endonuclease-3
VKQPKSSGGRAPHPARRRRAEAVLEGLHRLYPEADCELVRGDEFQLLVAVVLSAQCTDAKVNQATPGLFARWPEPAALAAAPLAEVEESIRTLGLFRAKAKNIVALSGQLVERHGGGVPRSRAELEALPGVGRKTANVVLPMIPGGEPALAVDTHVGRLARRLGLSREEDPLRVERDLTAVFPPESWSFVSHALILHGRRVCPARRPDCAACELAPHCASAFRAVPGKHGVRRPARRG